MNNQARAAASRTLVIVSAAAGLAVVTAAIAMLRSSGSERDLTSGDANRVVDALTSINSDELAAKDNADLRRKATEALRDAPFDVVLDRLRSEDLSQEDRERLEGNLRALMIDDMNRRAEEYDKAPPDRKQELLDRDIDDMQTFMKKMRDYREKHADEFQAESADRARRSHRPTVEQRKQFMEGYNPDRMAQMVRYWRAVRQRAQQRGVDFGPPGRGH